MDERQAFILPSESLHTMLPEHTPQVVECFAKLIHAIPQDRLIHLSTDEGRAILKAGFNHDDKSVCQRAEETQEDLLRRGYLNFMPEGRMQSRITLVQNWHAPQELMGGFEDV